jgi:hypothetical protein
MSNKEDAIYKKIVDYLYSFGFDFYDSEENFKNKYIEVMINPDWNSEEKTESLCDFLDGEWGLYDRYKNTYDFIRLLLDKVN